MRRDRDDGCDHTRRSRRVAFATTDDDDASRRVARHLHPFIIHSDATAHVVARAFDDADDDADDDASDDDSTDADDPSDSMSSSRSSVVLDDADGSSRVIMRDEIDDDATTRVHLAPRCARRRASSSFRRVETFAAASDAAETGENAAIVNVVKAVFGAGFAIRGRSRRVD